MIANLSGTKEYTRNHVSSGEACAFLDMAKNTLWKYEEQLGLQLDRNWRGARLFSVEDLQRIAEKQHRSLPPKVEKGNRTIEIF